MLNLRDLKRRFGWGAVALAVGALAACGGSPAPSGPASSTTSPTTTSATSPTSGATGSPAVTPTSPTSPTSTSSAGPTTPATPTYLSSVPVYFVGDSGGTFVLYREFRTVRKIDGPISSAVSAMTRLQPLDPDYVNPWRPASWVWVSQSGTTLKIDLSADAISGTNVGSELAARAVQQLVYTATAAAHYAGNDASTVVITINGKPADAWGVVRLGAPMVRAPMIDVQAQVWVTSPQEGDQVPAGLVRFTGYGTSFEGVFHWTVTASSGTVVAKGTAMGGSMGTFGTVSFSATLKAGGYTVRLTTDDPSGGEGRGPAVDTKYFTVR